MARFWKQLLPALLLGIGMLFGLPGQVGAEEALTPNLPRDPGDAPEAVVISSEITQEAEVDRIPAVGDSFTPSRWVCKLSATANKWFKGDRIVIPFTLYSYEAKYGEHDEKMYAYLVNEAGDVIGYYEDAFTADYEMKTVSLEIQGAQALEAGTYYMVYYSTYEQGNLNGRPIPIYVEEYDPARQYSYVELPMGILGKHFACGQLEAAVFTLNSLGYVGHEYFCGLYDSRYNLIHSSSGVFDYGVSSKPIFVNTGILGHLRPGTYYLRAYSSFDTKYKDSYFPVYIDNRGVGSEFDKASGTLTFFGSGEMQEINRWTEAENIKHVVIEPGITAVKESLCNNLNSLETVSLPDGLVSIGDHAFRGTKLKTVAIPNSVSHIGSWAFANCPELTTVTTFGSWRKASENACYWVSAFAHCPSLTRLEIPSSVVSLSGRGGDHSYLDRTIVFQDEAPTYIDGGFFEAVTATVYYPSDLDSWTEEIMQDYGGNLTWKPYDRQLEDVVLTEAVGHRTGNIIRWNASRHGDLYQVYRRAENETSWTLLKNTRSLAYKDESAKRGVKYYYKVRSRNGERMSSLDVPALFAVRPFELGETKLRVSVLDVNGVEIEWFAVKGAAFYQVFRRQQGQSEWTLLANTEQDSYHDNTGVPEKIYQYCVRARAGAGMGKLSNCVSAKVMCPLGYMSVYYAEPVADGIIIYWGANTRASEYEVYRRTADETEWTTVGRSQTLSFTDTTAKYGVQYFYNVRAWNGDLFSSMCFSDVSATRPYPLADVNMTKILGHKTGNIVYWEAVDGADLYQVFRRAESESGWTLIKNTRSLAYKDESAALGIKYYYKVRARNGDLMSSMDITALSAVRPYPLANVKMTKAVGHATGNIIYWEAVENAKLYQVYRRAADESGWTLIKNTGSLAYKDTQAQSGVTYYYKVVARNGDDCSSMDILAVACVRP